MDLKASIAVLCTAVLVGCGGKPMEMTPGQLKAVSQADNDMRLVIDTTWAMNPKPIEKCDSAQEARKQPSIGRGAMAVMEKRGIKPIEIGSITNKSFRTDEGNNLGLVVYSPKGNGPFPVIVYAHGGGWVVATPSDYEASCRALVSLCNAVVVSVDYRRAPEDKFPKAHQDCYAATQWVFSHAAELKGDPGRIAVAGESAGGNMAAAVCLMAKELHGYMPKHQLLIYPVGGYHTDTTSAMQYAEAFPLDTPALNWFYGKYLNGPADRASPYFDINSAAPEKLRDLPPATIITATIDPLHDDGKTYADHLKNAGVDVAYMNYDNVTHEFFGMGAVVDKARDAEAFAASRLNSAFNGH